MYKDLNEKVINMRNTMEAYSTSILPLIRQNDFVQRESNIIDEFLNHEHNCCKKSMSNNYNDEICDETMPTIDCMITHQDEALKYKPTNVPIEPSSSIKEEGKDDDNNDDNNNRELFNHECNMMNSNWREYLPNSQKEKY
jgi:hypothetical protein